MRHVKWYSFCFVEKPFGPQALPRRKGVNPGNRIAKMSGGRELERIYVATTSVLHKPIIHHHSRMHPIAIAGGAMIRDV